MQCIGDIATDVAAGVQCDWMKRSVHRLHNVAILLSLALSLATITLWVRSYRASDSLRKVTAAANSERTRCFSSERGTLSYSMYYYDGEVTRCFVDFEGDAWERRVHPLSR